MDDDGIESYDCEKHEARKRKGAHLEALFAEKTMKSSKANYANSITEGITDESSANIASITDPEMSSRTEVDSSVNSIRMYSPNPTRSYDNDGQNENEINLVRTSSEGLMAPTSSPIAVHRAVLPGNGQSPTERVNDIDFDGSSRYSSHSTSRESDRHTPQQSSKDHEDFVPFQSSSETRLGAVVPEHKSSDFLTNVTVKQEPAEDTCPVEVLPIQKMTESSPKDSKEIGEDCLKFLLFSGKLYHCEKISDLTDSFSRLIGDSVLGRKGKVVVLLLFHKTLREVLNYAVGVVDHYMIEEHNVVVKMIKHHTYPTSTADVEKIASKLSVGSRKLLYNLQPLNGPVYGELVKILDGFGANSSVDHAKISEFNAMVNANADRLDGKISNALGRLAYPHRGNHNIGLVSSDCTRITSRYPLGNSRYSPLTNHHTTSSHYSHEISHGGDSREMSSDLGYDSAYLSRHNAHYHKERRHVNTVSANQTVRITPRTAYSNIDHRTVSAVPIAPKPRFGSLEEGSIVTQRRNVEDLQTVAELCKEKMKRDMAEQELKSIKAAFEEFKTQMQKHLSQVEERMVLLQAENRSLKGKLSNMHQNNGFAEKKYHELRSQLEDLLKST